MSLATAVSVALPNNSVYRELTLVDCRDPTTWVASGGDERLLFSNTDDARLFFCDIRSAYRLQLELAYISVNQDVDGRHFFVNLGAAQLALEENSGARLSLCPEQEVKSHREKADVQLFYARSVPEKLTEGSIGRPSVSTSTVGSRLSEVLSQSRGSRLSQSKAVDEYCPHKSIWANNYTVIDDLSLGDTQRLILCDEATLTRLLPEERIFEHLRLIVNCHENRISAGKYKVGACTTGEMPVVICQAVHEWHSLASNEQNSVNDQIQAAIWEQLQTGTVAVHCLAGIHRAACIVACHFLWRHYTLGHQEVPSSADEIYRRLKAVRPAVSPAYTHVLRNYEKHLQTRGK